MAEKRRPYTGIGLRRPFEVCVCKWIGAPCIYSTFINIWPPGRDLQRGPLRTLTLHTQSDGGWGTVDAEENFGHAIMQQVMRPYPGEEGGGGITS